MGLFQKAVETYEYLNELAGKVTEGKALFAPIYHTVTKSQIEISLDPSGQFVDAEKNEISIIIPVTEASANRAGIKAYLFTHPLCEQMKHLTRNPSFYLPQLKQWIDSNSSHPKLAPVYQYVQMGTIENDLVSSGIEYNGNDLVRWRIIGLNDALPSACWEDPSLYQAHIRHTQEMNTDAVNDLCLITGRISPLADKHPKTIVPFQANAKLISSNDETNFTFRGRIADAREAATISQEATQKAHNALRWLVADQGVSFGGRTFLCWNPQGKKVASATGPFMRRSTPLIKPSDYREALHETLLGYRSELAAKDGVVIAAFDAATPGRLSVTYYNELLGSDFLDRLHDWEEYCCWINGPFGIQSPSLFQIACSAYGVQRKDKSGTKLVVDDRILRQQMQRLISCRIDKAQIPYDLVKSLVDHASSPQSYEEDQWRRILFTTCAILNKYDHDKKGMKEMDWSLDRKDRSFQFGRLLAAMERVEADYYYKTQEERQTSAIKAMSDFRQRPWNTYERINRHLLQAYIPRIDDYQRRRYAQLKDEIVTILSQFPASELNKPLSDAYLMGYDLQHAAFFEKKTNNTTTTEEE